MVAAAGIRTRRAIASRIGPQSVLEEMRTTATAQLGGYRLHLQLGRQDACARHPHRPRAGARGRGQRHPLGVHALRQALAVLRRQIELGRRCRHETSLGRRRRLRGPVQLRSRCRRRNRGAQARLSARPERKTRSSGHASLPLGLALDRLRHGRTHTRPRREVDLARGPPRWAIVADASPWGAGAVYALPAGVPLEFWATAWDAPHTAITGIRIGDSASQAPAELLAILLSVHVWGHKFASASCGMEVRSDSMAALRATEKLAGSHPA